MMAFAADADGRKYGDKIDKFAADVTTRILLPASFAYRWRRQSLDLAEIAV